MIGRTLFVETFVQIWVLLDLSRMDVALTHYLLWVKSWQYNWLDRPLLFRHLAFRRGKALKNIQMTHHNSCPSKEWKKRRRYFLCRDRDKCFIIWSGHYIEQTSIPVTTTEFTFSMYSILCQLKLIEYVGSVTQTECWLSGKAEPPLAGTSSVFLCIHHYAPDNTALQIWLTKLTKCIWKYQRKMFILEKIKALLHFVQDILLKLSHLWLPHRQSLSVFTTADRPTLLLWKNGARKRKITELSSPRRDYL